MTPGPWATLQGQIVQDRARYNWTATHADEASVLARADGRGEAYADVLDRMDFLLRLPIVPLADAWTELHAYVKEQRGIYDEQAAEHGELTGHEAQEGRAYGRVEAYDEVLAYMDSAEKEADR
jgi:hypothetical protein